MKAVVYHGPRQVSVDDVPDARIEKPTHVLVRITKIHAAIVPWRAAGWRAARTVPYAGFS